MPDKIATRQDINNLKSGAFSSELNRCPTYSEIMALGGLVINGSWDNNQLVTLSSISVTPVETNITPISYPFIFNSNSYALNTNFNNNEEFYEDLIFPIGYVVFEWSGFQTDNLGNLTGIFWDYDSSDLDWVNNSRVLLMPSGATGKSISATTPEGSNANMEGTSVSNSLSVEFDNQFLNRIPSESDMIVYIFDSSTISSDKYIGQIIYKNPEDDDILDSSHPLYKWSPDMDTSSQPPYAYNREISSNTNISNAIRFTANEITGYTPSTGSVFNITESHTDVALAYPIALAETYVGSGYEPLVGYLKTGVKAVDLSTLTGNLNCTITFNIDSKFGSNVRVSASTPISGGMYGDLRFIVGTGEDELNQLALVETGRDVSFTYTIDLTRYDVSGSGFMFIGVRFFIVTEGEGEDIISEKWTQQELLNTILPAYGFTPTKASNIVDNNQLLKYLHKNIKITVTDVEECTIEVMPD